MDRGLPKSNRLLTTDEYRRVYGRGRVLHGRQIQLFYLGNGLQHPRFGISVGRRMGKAVRRNLVRRRIREAIRLRKILLVSCGVDVIIHPRSSAGSLGSQSTFLEVHRLLRHLTRILEIPQERRTQIHSLLQAVCFAASTPSLSVLAILFGIFLSSHQ